MKQSRHVPPQNTNSGLVERTTNSSASRDVPVVINEIERQECEDVIEKIAIS